MLGFLQRLKFNGSVIKAGLTRRKFLAGALLASPAMLTGWSGLVEPNWIRLRRIKLTQGQPRHRFLHFTDLHYKGDQSELLELVKMINRIAADAVLFTGDLVEESKHLPGAIEGLSKIEAPLVGVPGNHDFWARIDFRDLARCFAAHGGAWLMDQRWPSPDGAWTVTGETCLGAPQNLLVPDPNTRNVLLVHYPAWAKKLGGRRYDLILAGHSHGGQVRLPFLGAPIIPFGVDEYDLGWFSTPGGPLYVNPGIGWFHLPFRFRCRPELTLFEF